MSKPLLCVTVTAATTAELRAKRDAVGDADLLELRLDGVSDPNVAGALAGRRTPVIVTCRPVWEGGAFKGSEDERRRMLGEALALGAEYVDVEFAAQFDDVIATTAGRRIVVSMHDYDGVPADLQTRVRAMRATGAEVLKVAVKANCLADCVPLLHLRSAVGDAGLVVVAMGVHGLVTRAVPGRFGSRWTYAGTFAEVGQVTADSLVQDYRFRSISDAPAIYGLVAGSTGHSVSPAMHNAAFDAAHADAVYLPFPAADAADFHRFGKAIGISGASVTIPHKVALFDFVDEVYAVASRIGAINTIRVVDGRWIGANTDATAFLTPLKDRVSLRGLRVAVLGAGGAARAVTVALASAGCASIRLHARHPEQARQVAVRAPIEIGPWPPEPGSWDLLVNCTPIGMFPRVNETPLPADLLTGRYVYDLVYNPPATRLVREAAAAGCQALGGLEMLVAQAQEQFQWWMDVKPPRGMMREAATKRLAEFTRDENYVV